MTTCTFNPFSADANQWGLFLLDNENLRKDFFESDPSTTPFKRAIEQVTTSDLCLHGRISIATRLVDAMIANWTEINGQIDEMAIFRDGVIHPLLLIPKIAYVNGVPDVTLSAIARRLWYETPNDELFRSILHTLERGLGEMVPWDNFTLETLYLVGFEDYKFLALEIMLDRGAVIDAARLFDEHAHKYPDFDPGTFDMLVAKGLPPSSAEKWLDISLARCSDSGLQADEARKRWAEIASQTNSP